MVRSLAALFVTLAACASSSSTGSSSGASGGSVPLTESSDPKLAGMVAAHNAVRAAVSPAPATPLTPLQWNGDDAAVAKDWAAQCRFEHNPGRGSRGENIFAAAGQAVTAEKVVQSWAGEAKNYTYASNQCSGTCGHYTQVVWADTTHVGCAAQTCTTGSPFGGGSGGSWELWVCDYSPPGNFVGKKPY